MMEKRGRRGQALRNRFAELTQVRLTQARPAQLIGCGIRFFLAASLTAAQLSDGSAPFALGCVAAAGVGAESVSALLGVGVGLLLFEDFTAGLAHLAAAILIATAAAAFRGLKLMEKPWFFPLCAAALCLTVRLVYVLQSFDPVGDLPSAATAAVLTGVCAWRYAPLFHAKDPRAEPDGLLFLAATLLLPLLELKLAGVSAGRVALAILFLSAAWRRGAREGAVLGLCGGMLCDLCTGGSGAGCTAFFGLGGLAAGLCAGRSRIGAAALWLLGGILPLSMPGALSGAAAVEWVLPCLLFLLLPGRLLRRGQRIQKAEARTENDPAGGLKLRLQKTAAAFRELCDSLGHGAPESTEENPAVIFDRAAEKVCRDCSLCALCWKKEYVTTYNALNDATPFLLERGRLLGKDLPRHFSDRCIHLPDFLTAVNGELSAFLLRRQYRRQLAETQRSARRQYAQLGDLLSATAAGLDCAPAAARSRPCVIGAALRPKEGERVCGDSLASFETERGTLYLLLSDGCGSGEAARRESAMTNRLLRQFLEADIAPESALKTMNAALALRGEETGSFSTIDLLALRPDSGEAALFKYGAAPTYVKKNGSIRRITGGALPAGLRDPAALPDVTRLTLEGGSFTVMISDGIADALNDEWLQDLLAGWDGDDAQALAGLVLQEGVRRNAGADDCCVQVLYLPPEGRAKRS
jgi:hypothetical protein